MNRETSQPQPVVNAISPDSRNGEPSRRHLPANSLGHLSEALRIQWKRYRKRLKRCQKKFSDTAVHDSRVETRRLLATVELFAPFLDAARVRKIERSLKRHLDTFDELRDTQVQLLSVSRLAGSYPAAGDLYGYLRMRRERLARTTRKGIKHVRTRRLGKLITACQKELAKRQGERVPKATGVALLRGVDRAFDRTRRLRARIDPSDTTTIHRTRVAFKKFRYMVETLAGYLPEARGALLRAMHRYQTLMGDIQDAEVLVQTLDKYLAKDKIEPARARGFRGELLRRRGRRIRSYLRAADQLQGFWPLLAGKAGVRLVVREPSVCAT